MAVCGSTESWYHQVLRIRRVSSLYTSFVRLAGTLYCKSDERVKLRCALALRWLCAACLCRRPIKIKMSLFQQGAVWLLSGRPADL